MKITTDTVSLFHLEANLSKGTLNGFFSSNLKTTEVKIGDKYPE